MADSYVCSGATMRCSMGTCQAKLTVLPSRTVFLTGQPQANISDHLSMVNLAPFGRCRSLGFPATASATAAAHGKLTPMPCMHNTPFPWMGGKNDYIIKNDPALLKSSTCQCMWGGTISITDDGQHGEGTQWVNKKNRQDFDSEIPLFNDVALGEVNAERQRNSYRPEFDKYPAVLKNKINELANSYRKKGFSPKDSLDRAQSDVHRMAFNQSKKMPMTDELADLNHANPNYKPGNIPYGTNCVIASITFILRKQGYNVTAKGNFNSEQYRKIAGKDNPYKIMINSDGSEAKPTKIRDAIINKVNLDKQKIKKGEISKLSKKSQYYKETLIESCKEEGYYLFLLSWNSKAPVKDKSGKTILDQNGKAIFANQRHATIIKSTKNKEGNIVLTHIEPQTGVPYQNIDTLLDNLALPNEISPNDGVMRIDDKQFNMYYHNIVNIEFK